MMCSTRGVIDPGGLLYGDKTSKWADPLKITHTAVGDPTGHVRRERARIEREGRPFQGSGITSVKYTTLGAAAPGGTVLGG